MDNVTQEQMVQSFKLIQNAKGCDDIVLRILCFYQVLSMHHVVNLKELDFTSKKNYMDSIHEAYTAMRMNHAHASRIRRLINKVSTIELIPFGNELQNLYANIQSFSEKDLYGIFDFNHTSFFTLPFYSFLNHVMSKKEALFCLYNEDGKMAQNYSNYNRNKYIYISTEERNTLVSLMRLEMVQAKYKERSICIDDKNIYYEGSDWGKILVYLKCYNFIEQLLVVMPLRCLQSLNQEEERKEVLKTRTLSKVLILPRKVLYKANEPYCLCVFDHLYQKSIRMIDGEHYFRKNIFHKDNLIELFEGKNDSTFFVSWKYLERHDYDIKMHFERRKSKTNRCIKDVCEYVFVGPILPKNIDLKQSKEFSVLHRNNIIGGVIQGNLETSFYEKEEALHVLKKNDILFQSGKTELLYHVTSLPSRNILIDNDTFLLRVDSNEYSSSELFRYLKSSRGKEIIRKKKMGGELTVASIQSIKVPR